jgi:Mlc titration factor MtfA (ptsG expression regulator)
MLGFSSLSRRRQKLLAKPPPEEWRRILEQNLGVYARLPSDQQQKLLATIQVITAERPFVGLRGLTITDEVRVTIAGQAALLLLGDNHYHFDRVGTIYVQPSSHHARAYHDLGGATLVVEGVSLLGQAFDYSVVRLAWDAALHGGRVPTDGENVVLHEFAHHLDALDGEIDGIPPLPRERQRRHWALVFDEELALLRNALRAGEETLLPENAAENEAELFAYATECFFEQPGELAEWHEDLFACLLDFYRIDPCSWFPPGSA